MNAEEFFKQNYHTPMDSFLGKYGVPVLHGVHPCGTEEWSNIPIAEVMEAYLQHRVNEISDDKVDAVCRLRWRKEESEKAFKNGVKWFKNKLIKQ